MKDAVARCGVTGFADGVLARELPRDRRLPLVRLLAGEHEMVAGDRGLPGLDGVAAGDLIEGVDGERRRAVGGRQQVGPEAQRRSRPDRRVPVHAVGEDDLLGERHRTRLLRVGELDARLASDRFDELAPPDRQDAARAPDLLLLIGERDRPVAFPLGQVGEFA